MQARSVINGQIGKLRYGNSHLMPHKQSMVCGAFTRTALTLNYSAKCSALELHSQTADNSSTCTTWSLLGRAVRTNGTNELPQWRMVKGAWVAQEAISRASRPAWRVDCCCMCDRTVARKKTPRHCHGWRKNDESPSESHSVVRGLVLVLTGEGGGPDIGMPFKDCLH